MRAEQEDRGIVYLSHGKKSHPHTDKMMALTRIAEKRGFSVVRPDYTSTMQADERLKMLLALKPRVKHGGTLVLAGSSMGGYISAASAKEIKPQGLFLLAPAFYLPGYGDQDPNPAEAVTEIIHGWLDTTVPPENALRFAQKHHATCHMVPGDHRLLAFLPHIEHLFDQFLKRMVEGSRS